ncbi:MAG: hypothetical protein ACJ76F_05340 [Bacteroidia bacterium]
MELFLFILYFSIFCFCILRFSFFRNAGIPGSWLAGAFVLKVAVGFLTWLFYLDSLRSMPQGDIFSFVHDGAILNKVFYSSPSDYFRLLSGIYQESSPMELQHLQGSNLWHQHFITGYINDNRVFIRLNSLFSFFSLNSIHIHSLFINFLSFTGLIALFRSFKNMLPAKEKLFFAVLFLMPSVLFWGSSLLKESFMLFNFGMFVYHAGRASESKLIRHWLFALVFLFLSLLCKPYVILCFFLPFIAYLYNLHRRPNRAWPSYIFSLAGVVLIIFSVNFLMSGKPLSALVKKQNDFVNLSKGGIFLLNDTILVRLDPALEYRLQKNVRKNSFFIAQQTEVMYWRLDRIEDTIRAVFEKPVNDLSLVWDIKPAGSAIHLDKLETNWWSIFKVLPYSFYNGFVRPGLWDVHNASSLGSAIEMSIYISCLLALLLFSKKRSLNRNLLFLSISFILLLCCLIGLTVPVLGSTVRYRIPALIFLGILLVNLFDVNSAFANFRLKNK